MTKQTFLPRFRASMFLLASVIHSGCYADIIISLYLRAYPQQDNSCVLEDIAASAEDPWALSNYSLRSLCEQRLAAGIFALYAGNATLSDLTGHIVFPLKHSGDELYVLVTERIIPIMMFFNTIHHWEVERDAPAKMFKYNKVYNNQEGLYYWLVEEVPLPEDLVVPIASITLLARPWDLNVTDGHFVTPDTPNFLLPDILVYNSINKVYSALHLLDVRHFFGSIDAAHKLDKGYYHHQRGR